MAYSDNEYIKARDLSFAGILHDIKKSKTALQPVFEAFTNAIEAIKIKSRSDSNFTGEIEIIIKGTENTDQTHDFSSITITDNGIGFNDEEFARFNVFKDTTKNFKNLGSGRIQFVHYFDNTIVKSQFVQDGEYYEREFVVSKKKLFLDNNSIVLHRYCKESLPYDTGTSVTFNTLLENSPLYNSLNDEGLKEELLKRYVHYFCHNKSSLPKINIKFYIQSELKGESFIEKKDVPNIDQTENIELPYCKISPDGKSIQPTDNKENFRIDAFKVQSSMLSSNDLKLVSKGEIVEDSNVTLQNLPKSENVKGYKYLFLVSSNYIDSRDTNMRGILNIPSRDSFKSHNLFTPEEILLDDIQDMVNNKINTMYPEIETVKQQHEKSLDELKEMFLLDDEVADGIKISINDSDSKILEKFYEAESKKVASLDAAIKTSFDNLNKLNPADPNHINEFNEELDKIVKAIPMQNKKSLTHYVARRKLVLDLLDKIINKKLDVQQADGKCNEAWIHNLLFMKGSDHSGNSDLWIINEDFIYFNGNSQTQIKNLKIGDKNIFKQKFTEEEQKHIFSLGENRTIKCPDVLLFPDEGKCIIIEFKAPNVNVSEHLTQINKYASLIRNYTEDEFQITTFYGYLLGESIDPKDVMGAVSSFEYSYQFDYLFSPAQKVTGFDGRTSGSIYTEVIKYSTLLLRAQQRNKVFIDKLR